MSSERSFVERLKSGEVVELTESVQCLGPLHITSGVHATLTSTTTDVVTVEGPVLVDEGGTLLLRGVTMVVQDHMRCSGRVEVIGGAVRGGILVCGRGGFECNKSSVVGHITILDHASATLTDCTVEQTPVKVTPQVGIVFQETAAIVAGNSASLIMTGCSVAPTVGRQTKCGIRGETRATVRLKATYVGCGVESCVHLIGCAGEFTQCLFADQNGSGLTLASPNRTSGVTLEHAKGKLMQCIAFQAYFGFIMVHDSEGTLDDCFACDAVNGVTVDGSAAVLQHCHTLVEHVSVVVLNKGKCTVRAPHSDAKTKVHELQKVVAERYVSLANSARVALVQICSKAPSSTSFTTDLESLQTTFFDGHKDGPCVMLFGRYGLEANTQSLLDVSNVLCIGAKEDGVRVSDGAEATLSFMLIMVRSPLLQHHGVRTEPRMDDDKSRGVLCHGARTIDASHITVSGYTFGFFDANAISDVTHVLTTVEDWNTTHLYSNCTASACVNGFTIDGSIARIEDCVANNASSVGVYLLTKSQARVRGGKFSGTRYGVEARGAILTCEGTSIDVDQLSYVVRGEGGRLRAFNCTAIKGSSIGEGEDIFAVDEGGRIKLSNCTEVPQTVSTRNGIIL
ncbi:Hypothetical protein, putative [Bodo saltans]|uniref:Right handed beta helix domain-containing protein n=1 Tax=Bodo saltans TaxID=75058 RepID=A0A0S4IXZ7_BODSA|nr:Hypothetical protein, putative [Bodo saltans]|eukprot:CUF95039.1 Hypothetical protein, putative [Bodo saltans]